MAIGVVGGGCHPSRLVKRGVAIETTEPNEVTVQKHEVLGKNKVVGLRAWSRCPGTNQRDPGGSTRGPDGR
jgi:hypothetical protein